MFDPTPASSNRSTRAAGFLGGLSRYLDYVQFQWANLVVSYDADQRRSLGRR